MSQSNLTPRKIFLRRKTMRLRSCDYSKKGHYLVTIDCKNMECRFGHVFKGRMILNEFGRIAFDEWLKLSFRYKNFQLNVFQIMPNHMHAIVSLLSPDEINNELVLMHKELAFSSHHILSIDGLQILNYSETSVFLEQTKAGASPANAQQNSLNNNIQPYKTLSGESPDNAEHNSLSDIVGAYKSIVSNLCLEMHKQKHIDKKHVPLLGKIWHRGFWDDIINDQSVYKSITRYIISNPKNWARDKHFKK